MSCVLSDANGQVTDLGSAVEVQLLMNWLKNAGSSEIEVFIENGFSEFPAQLVMEIEDLIGRDRPNHELVDLVETLLSGLRRAKDYVMVEL